MNRILKAASAAIGQKLTGMQKRRSVGLNWFKEKYLKHHQSLDVKKYRLFGRDLSYVAEYDLLHSLEELFIEEVYKADLGLSPLIIDCGANIGLSTLYLKRRHPDATVIAFEPDITNYALLKANTEAFGLQNVHLHQQAVWKEETALSFKSIGSLGSAITLEGGADTYSVNAVKLSNYITTGVALLKMDIEGAEYQVLKEIDSKLPLVERLFIEYHSSFAEEHKLLEILGMMHRHGFSFYIKEGLDVYSTPFSRDAAIHPYDIQLNIFCFRT